MFLPETGAFLPLPKLATEPFLKLWEQEMFALLLREGKITEEVVQNIRRWKHLVCCTRKMSSSLLQATLEGWVHQIVSANDPGGMRSYLRRG
jgi:hypothetical protein